MKAMGILIKGMKMPENCCKCEWHESYGGDYDWCHACRLTGNMPIENAESKRSDECPLTELPEKHGRLVDADEFLKKMNLAIAMISRMIKEFGAEDDEVLQMELKSYRDIRDGLKEEPTIIEAEGDEG